MGILREKFDTQTRQRSRIRDSAKVCQFIINGEWILPHNRLEEMSELWRAVQTIRPSQNHEPDKLVWMPHPRGKYTIKTAYTVLRTQHPKTPWTRLFWTGACIPRQATIAWMAVQDTLMTQDRLVQWNSLKISNCVLCNNQISDRVTSLNSSATTYSPVPIIQRPSSQVSSLSSLCNQLLYDHYKQASNTSIYHWAQQHASSSTRPIPENGFHIFFECQLAGSIWKQALAWCGVTRKHTNSVKEWRWILRRLAGHSLHKLLIQTTLTATIYWIWGERNARIFKQQARTEQQLVQLIIRDVKIKLGSSKANYIDNDWNRLAAIQVGQAMNIVSTQQVWVSWEPPPQG
ncbi:hypothetical protein FRX31_009674 [Thalictrum thalictroides]|uniref:Reverse transcriptase zinc-binding domain-containing protein n=1 Tax=Thalictrum thalictroides TaxID=46969 RepID=A0A7J6WVH5_THATH|nr:hypothetical protein FRX31_009674 [Thalictrum thalictroides]